MMRNFVLILFAFALSTDCYAGKQTIEFSSLDDFLVTADLYMAHPKTAPLIVLFHQARWSRGEYKDTAPRLNAMGFNCLAVDQRSGGEVNGMVNQTHQRATAKGLSTDYIDALPDMIAATRYASDNYAKGSLILLGSSYSASLVFVLAAQFTDIVDGVVAFSPGEYFRSAKGSTYIQKAASKLVVPVFVTSARNEANRWRTIFNAVQSKSKRSFIPQGSGEHGSRALWEQNADSDDYWMSLTEFLQLNFPFVLAE